MPSTVVISILLSGCASIVSKSDYPVTFISNPNGANIIVKDIDRKEVYKGTTPATLTLPASSGFFQGARYNIIVSKEGYNTTQQTLKSGIDLWYLLGNFIFGGLIGYIIVDPLTSAMFTLPKEERVNLSQASLSGVRTGLNIVSINDVPKSLISNVISVN